MSPPALDPRDRAVDRLYRRHARDVYRFVLAVSAPAAEIAGGTATVAEVIVTLSAVDVSPPPAGTVPVLPSVPPPPQLPPPQPTSSVPQVPAPGGIK